jgi:hypothetical protein
MICAGFADYRIAIPEGKPREYCKVLRRTEFIPLPCVFQVNGMNSVYDAIDNFAVLLEGNPERTYPAISKRAEHRPPSVPVSFPGTRANGILRTFVANACPLSIWDWKSSQ